MSNSSEDEGKEWLFGGPMVMAGDDCIDCIGGGPLQRQNQSNSANKSAHQEILDEVNQFWVVRG